MTHPPVFFASPAAFRDWLAAHAASKSELIVGFHKVATGRPSMSWSESVDEALCFGWIDGVRRRIDEERYCIRFTPRRPGSIWSAVNLAKVEALRATGRMQPAGEAVFAQRLAHKSAVYSYEQPPQLPADLSAAELRLFKHDKSAWAFFNDAHPPSARKTLLHWVCSAKKPDTRAARLAKLIAACSVGQRLR
ncbi:MAG: bacteriocin-protection protein [Methylibium sp.]|nr:bacteriocin-protection protein [Methylibium sp.]